MWDFISLRPETTHQVSFLFADRGIPDGYRHMNGYGSHTFKTVNEAGEAFYVKWHFKTDQGIKNLSVAEADRLAGADPEYAIRDLYNVSCLYLPRICDLLNMPRLFTFEKLYFLGYF